MILSILVFLLSVVETETFTPFPSGYTTSQENALTTVTLNQNEGFYSAAPGAPFLPLVSRVFILPGRGKVLSVSSSFNETVSRDQLVYPLAGAPVVHPIGGSFSRDLFATSQNLVQTEPSVSVHTGHILNSLTIVSFSVNPWIYDVSTQELGLAPSCTLEFEWETTGNPDILSARQTEMVNFRADAISERFGADFAPLPILPGSDSAVDYLIITGEAFLDEVAILQDLLEQKSITYQTLTVEDITGNWGGIDVQEDIRNCITHYAYNEGTTYVALAGDETVVPAREAYTECEGEVEFAPTDLYYADLDGTWDFNQNGIYGEYADSLDLYADVLLGRILFSTSAGAVAFFDKNTVYANTSESETWHKQAVLCGAMLFDDIGYNGAKGCEVMADEFQEDFTLTKAYELTVGVGDYFDTYFPVLYSGAGWNHYAGHGNNRGVYWAFQGRGILNIQRMIGFSEKSLGNPGRSGIHTAIGCHTGDFTNDDGLGLCLADTLLTLPEGGGVACIFNSTWGWEGFWPEIGSSERLCNNTVEQVYQRKASSLGLAYTAAKDSEIPMMTGPYDRVMQSVLAYTAFMDPSLKVLGVNSFIPMPPPSFEVIMLSPNPLHSNLQLAFKVKGLSTAYDVSIYNLAGRVVQNSVTLAQNAVLTRDVSYLPVGIYFVSARAESGATTSGSFVLLR